MDRSLFDDECLDKYNQLVENMHYIEGVKNLFCFYMGTKKVPRSCNGQLSIMSITKGIK